MERQGLGGGREEVNDPDYYPGGLVGPNISKNKRIIKCNSKLLYL